MSSNNGSASAAAAAGAVAPHSSTTDVEADTIPASTNPFTEEEATAAATSATTAAMTKNTIMAKNAVPTAVGTTTTTTNIYDKKLGDSNSTVKSRQKAMNYLDKYCESRPYPPDKFVNITSTELQSEHCKLFLEGFGIWFAAGEFITIQKKPLSLKSKMDYFKTAKELLKMKCPDNIIFTNPGDPWFKIMLSRFIKECKRENIMNDGVFEERKSLPIYSDLEALGINRLIRAKYSNNYSVDGVSITKFWIKNINEKNAQLLAEFLLSFHGIGRGAEHAFLRYSEAAWDPFFQAIDFDWAIVKQLNHKCMLFFCHHTQYCLCPYFGLAVHFLFGGLLRNSMHEGLHDFVFPYAHALSMDSITSRLTDGIRATIPDETRKKEFTTRSTRKGAMGENRMNQNLTIKQEYARSGHTGPEMNSNAEGYIDSIPAMNAAGGMSLAGFKDPNSMVWPYSFDSLGLENSDAVNTLIHELFQNDVEHLEFNGKIRSLLVTAAARLVGSYIRLMGDVGGDNNIVRKIQSAARRANIDDTSIPINNTLSPRWSITLRAWSRKIEEEFKSKNRESVPENAPLTQQLTATMSTVQSIGKSVFETLTEHVQGIASDSNAMNSQLANMQSQLGFVVTQLTTLGTVVTKLAQQVQQQSSRDEENEKLRRQVGRLQTMLMTSPVSSPAGGVKRGAETDPPLLHSPNDNKRCRMSLTHKDSALYLNATAVAATVPPSEYTAQSRKSPTPSILTAPAALRPSSNATAPAVLPQLSNATLDGIPTNIVATSGITVFTELERLWRSGLIKRAADAVDNGATLSKKILFDPRQRYFVGYNENFAGNEQSRYENAMTVVAMSIQSEQWTSMCRGELTDNKQKRKLFASIVAATLNKCLELEGKAGTKSKARDGLVSVGSRFQKFKTKWKAENKKSDLEVEQMIMEKIGDGQVGGQSTIRHYFSKS